MLKTDFMQRLRGEISYLFRVAALWAVVLNLVLPGAMAHAAGFANDPLAAHFSICSADGATSLPDDGSGAPHRHAHDHCPLCASGHAIAPPPAGPATPRHIARLSERLTGKTQADPCDFTPGNVRNRGPPVLI